LLGVELAEHADAPIPLTHQRFDEGGDLAEGEERFGRAGSVPVVLVFGYEGVEFGGDGASGHFGSVDCVIRKGLRDAAEELLFVRSDLICGAVCEVLDVAVFEINVTGYSDGESLRHVFSATGIWHVPDSVTEHL